MFIDNGIVAFVTTYHKGFGLSQRVKIVHRHVPREVGELVVYYLWLVEPFVQSLQIVVQEQFDSSPWLWEPKPEDQWKEDDEEGEGQFDEEGVEPEPDANADADAEGEWSDDGEEWLDGVVPAAVPAEPHNVDGFWDTDRVRRVMYRESEARIGVRIGVSLWRNAYPAIQRELSADTSVHKALDDIYGRHPAGPPSHDVEDIRAQQAGHSRQMEEMIYGLLLTASPFTTQAEQERFRKVSIDWHRLLHFPSSWEEGPSNMPVHRRMRKEEEEARVRRWQQMRGVDVEAQLKQLYGPAARFRGMQRSALDAIVAGAPRVLAIMRTGGGKSLLFTLPAAGSRDGVTAVVVPTVALREDQIENCGRDGIECAAWNGQRPPYHARIVFVTPESAVSLAFGRFMDEKRTAYQLERIVIDECHNMLDSTPDWRPKMLQLSEMVGKDVPVVYLTATLPPAEEPEFYQAIGVDEREMVVFRDVTTRPNIAYSVVPYRREEEDTAVRRMVESKKVQYAAPGQIVVFCKTVAQTERLGGFLGCSVYHRHVGTAREKKGILRSLTGQTERVFTATNALGEGVNAASIRVVIHVGIREKLKQYVQESGRAGRDGKASEAIIMRAHWTHPDGVEKQEQGWRTEAAMKTYLRGENCRRMALDQRMDGRTDRSGCERGEERCDVCRGRARGRKRRRIVVHNEEVGEEVSGESDEERRRGRRPTKTRRIETEQDSGVDESERDSPGEETEQDPRIDTSDSEEQHRRGVAQQIARQGVEQEQQVYRRIRQQQRRQTMDKGDAVDGMREAFQAWQGRCSICIARCRSDNDHTQWRECPYNDKDRQATQKAWQSLGEVVFQPYSRCNFCWAPQAICHLWEDVSHSGPQRFRRRKGGACQFPGVLRDTVAVIIGIYADTIGDWIDEQAQKGGFGGQEEESEWERWKGWFGQKLHLHGIEASGLCAVFWEVGLPSIPRE